MLALHSCGQTTACNPCALQAGYGQGRATATCMGFVRSHNHGMPRSQLAFHNSESITFPLTAFCWCRLALTASTMSTLSSCSTLLPMRGTIGRESSARNPRQEQFAFFCTWEQNSRAFGSNPILLCYFPSDDSIELRQAPRGSKAGPFLASYAAGCVSAPLVAKRQRVAKCVPLQLPCSCACSATCKQCKFLETRHLSQLMRTLSTAGPTSRQRQSQRQAARAPAGPPMASTTGATLPSASRCSFVA